MHREHSFGIIPVQKREKKWWVFLVHHQKGHWAFPKGHADEGEDPRKTAERELFEETGLSIAAYRTDAAFDEHYLFREADKEVDKTVTYFLAEVQGEIVLQKEEIAQGEWTLLEKAEQVITFPEGKKLLQEIAPYLT